MPFRAHRVDPAAAAPLEVQAASQLRAAIRSGALGAGDALPGTRDLAQAMGISKPTAARAYAALADEGLVTPLGRRGYRVAPVKAEHRGRFARQRIGQTVESLLALDESPQDVRRALLAHAKALEDRP